MKLKLPDSLRARIVLLISLSTIPPLGVALYSAFTENSRIQADALDATFKLTKMASQYQSGLIEGTSELLLTLSHAPVVSGAIWDKCNSFLHNALGRNKRYSNIGVIDLEGNVVCSAVNLKSPINLSDRRYFQEALRERRPSVGDYHVGRITNIPSIGMAAPVFDEAGQLHAVVFASIKLDTFKETIDSLPLPENASLMIFDRKGDVLIDSKNARNKFVVDKAKHILLHRLPNQSSGSVIVKVNKKPWVFSWTPIRNIAESQAITIFVASSLNEAIAEERRYYFFSLGLMFLTSLIIFAIAIFGSNLFIMRGVNALIATTKAIGNGRFNVRTNAKLVSGELKLLANHIEKMAAQIEQNLEREKEYRYLFQRNPNPMWIMTCADTRFLAVNEAAIEHYGYTEKEFLNMTVYDILPLWEQKRAMLFIEDHQNQQIESSVWQHLTKSGELIHVDAQMQPIEFQSQQAFIVSIKDITNERLARAKVLEKDQIIQSMLQSTTEAICGIDLDGICTFANPAMVNLLGYRKDSEIIGKNSHYLAHHTATDGTKIHAEDCKIYQAIMAGKITQSDKEYFIRKNGTSFPVEYRTHPIYKDEELVGGLVTFQDISERKAHYNALEHIAEHDMLTGLANRRLLNLKIAKAIKENTLVVLLLIDLDQFKEINNTLGHQYGDLLLISLANRLNTWAGKEYCVARLGGDEFAVLGTNINKNDTLKIANTILDLIRQPVEVSGIRIQISGSIGVSLYPFHSKKPDALLRFADIAMYQAKHVGSSIFIYDPRKDAHSAEKLTLMSDLHQAIDNNELVLHFQPKVNAEDKKIVGFEALIRWNHPTRGLIPPDTFIPLIELTSLIRPFTKWIMNSALQECAHWNSMLSKTKIAVNISTRNLLDFDLINQIEELLAKHQVEPSYLELEITESALMADPDRALEILNSLHNKGIKLAIDDFGTGYSSMSYLQKLPVDIIKIDRSFISTLTTDPNTHAIVESMINLAHSLHMSVVAEGVEDELTFNKLKDANCDVVQGFYISKPVPAAAIESMILAEK